LVPPLTLDDFEDVFENESPMTEKEYRS